MERPEGNIFSVSPHVTYLYFLIKTRVDRQKYNFTDVSEERTVFISRVEHTLSKK
jgi:hypothetical protein